MKTPNEECDDDNEDNSDGCDSDCAVEEGWECTDTAFETSSCDEICGDGKVVGSEVCDDGDTDPLTGCNANCKASASGYDCTGGDSSTASTCVEVCGDGVRTAGEECDDDNLETGDGCDGVCAVEDGWECSDTLRVKSDCNTLCGDGKVIGDEV